MRKIWIAIAMIALLVGLAAGYWVGRPGKPPPESKNAVAVSETPPEPPAVPAPSAAVRQEVSHLPDAPREEPASRPPDRDDASRSPQRFREEKPGALPEAVASTRSAPGDSAAPDGITNAASPPVPIHGKDVAPATAKPVAPPTTSPITSPTTPATSPPAATQDSAKPSDTPAEGEDPQSDRKPPVLQFLRFDPPEAKGGGTTTLSIGSTDELSGVKLVYGAVRSPSGTASLQFSASDTGGGVFVAPIVIPLQAETGDWFVANLQIVDKADNALTLAFARATVPEGGALRVVSDDSDSKPPDVHRVSVLKSAVDAGESNRITVDVDDDRSGVALVMGAFQSPSKAAFIPFTCTPTDATTWEADVPVPIHADCGEWTLRQLRVVDKANNSEFLSMDAPQIGHVGFLVSGGGACDSQPPVIDSIYFAPSIVSNAAATTVVLNVASHDDASGVASISGWIEGPVATNGQAPRMPFAATPDPQNPDAPMIARITVPQFAAQGIWRVTIAQIADKARNTRTYSKDDPALRDASFRVD